MARMSAPTIRCDPRTQYIGKVPNDKENEEAPANATHGNWSDLTDHGVEGEGHHGGCTDARDRISVSKISEG
jgi:hypothetical protein